MLQTIDETWKEIDRFPGYSVSSLGRVKTRSGKIKAQHIDNWGYFRTNFYIPALKKSRNTQIHTLVCHAFFGKKQDKMQINHRDGDKKNNCITNLEYCTASKNVRHALHLGLYKNRKPRLPLLLFLLIFIGCRNSQPPTIEVCIGTGVGSADCIEADGQKLVRLPSELENYWMTSESDMQRWSSWCYGSSSPEPIKAAMDHIKEQVK